MARQSRNLLPERTGAQHVMVIIRRLPRRWHLPPAGCRRSAKVAVFETEKAQTQQKPFKLKFFSQMLGEFALSAGR
jgi:hypothetical protein